jgi:segregation and condensation protein B
MGVRGKIEAVIYAAEEPVTLPQLAALFGEEALAEREAAATESTEMQEAEPVASQPELPELHADPAPQEPEEQVDTAQEDQQQGLELELEGRKIARQRERAAREAVRQVIDELMAEYRDADGGMEIREVAGGYRVATKPEYHDAVRAFVKSLKPVMKLSLQALETLAVIAYKQPVTAPEVSEIRGVDSGGVLGSLISRKLVTTAGRKPVVGRPILYKTTKEFLLRFGLKDIAELPSMEEFEKMAGELQGLADELVDGAAPEAQSGSKDDQAIEPEPRNEVGAPPVERPSLAPAPIVVTVEDEPVPGISVTLSGTAKPDLVAPESTSNPAAEDGEPETNAVPLEPEHE